MLLLKKQLWWGNLMTLCKRSLIKNIWTLKKETIYGLKKPELDEEKDKTGNPVIFSRIVT